MRDRGGTLAQLSEENMTLREENVCVSTENERRGEDSRGGGCIVTRSTSFQGFEGGEGGAREKYSAGAGTDGDYFLRRGKDANKC